MFQSFQQVEAFFESRSTIGIKPGLNRMKKLLKEVENPQDRMQAIHVAGTNGKGSTIQFIQRALMANGFRVGVFTSPSLDGLTGHILRDGNPISKDTFLILLNRLYPAIKKLDKQGDMPTEFEILTVMAIMHFSDNNEIAIIEAGMGGREDTTNCFQPILSIITNISKDHTKFLGSTTKEIAYHKAGIIKKNAPVIIGEISNEIEPIFIQETANAQTVMYQLEKDFCYRNIKHIDNNQQFIWNGMGQECKVQIQMYGKHQVKNASLALMAIYVLKDIGYAIHFRETMKAFKASDLPGRFEVINDHPLIIVDGAHNSAGVETFVETVKTAYPNKSKHILFAAFKDKELSTMLSKFESCFASVTFTTFSHSRATPALTLFNMSNHKNKRLVANWREAIETMHDEEAVYFITGSLHFISKVRTYFDEER